MPPEQAAGRTGEVGPASDVYGLGAILYCLLTGRPPFQAATVADTLRQVVEREPVSPRQLNAAGAARPGDDLPEVPGEGRRGGGTRSAAELAEDLGRFLDGGPIQARPVGPGRAALAVVPAEPGGGGLVAASPLRSLALVAAAVSLAYSRRLESAYRSEAVARRAADEQRGLALRAQAETQRALTCATYAYFHRIGLAHHAWLEADVLRAGSSWTSVRRAPRGWEWHYLDRLRHAHLWSFGDGGRNRNCVAFSPDGSRLAVTGTGGVALLRIRDVRSGRLILTFEDMHSCAAFSPDGTRLVAEDTAVPHSRHRLLVRDIASRNVLATLDGHPG